MRKIKFRGVSVDNGSKICGDLMHGDDGEVFIVALNQELYRVQSDSVAQFVGYDADGSEVYEGDIVIGEHDGVEYRYRAQIHGEAITANGEYLFSRMFKTSFAGEGVRLQENYKKYLEKKGLKK